MRSLLAFVLLLHFGISEVARAEKLGQDGPSAPTALEGISEEAFAQAMGLIPEEAKPEPPPAPVVPVMPPEPPPVVAAAEIPVLPPEPVVEPPTALPDLSAGQSILTDLSAIEPEKPAVALEDNGIPIETNVKPMVVNNPLPIRQTGMALLSPEKSALVADCGNVSIMPAPLPPPPSAFPAGTNGERRVPETTAMPIIPGVADVAVILADNQFFPSRIRLKNGTETRLLFTTVNRRPAALIIERMDVQRWVSSEKTKTFVSEMERAQFELNREVSASRITEVVIEPHTGVYSFHDALTGAAGEIVVE